MSMSVREEGLAPSSVPGGEKMAGCGMADRTHVSINSGDSYAFGVREGAFGLQSDLQDAVVVLCLGGIL